MLEQTALNPEGNDLNKKQNPDIYWLWISQPRIYEQKTIFIPVPTGAVTQDERNCDHKTGKTSKRENHFSMNGPIG